MKTYTSQAIIMRTMEFGETDLLVTFFTLDNGRLKGIAKGARKSRKRFANCLDVLCLTELEYSLKREGALYFLNSGKLLNAHPEIRSDFTTFSKASFMVELTEILFPWGVADRNMFELLRGALDALGEADKGDIIPLIFEIKAMTLGGYGINLEKCAICGRRYKGEGRAVFKRDKGGIACLKCHQESAITPGLDPQTVKMIKLMQADPLSSLLKLHLIEDMVKQIRPALKLHREYHLGQRPKTAHYLE